MVLAKTSWPVQSEFYAGQGTLEMDQYPIDFRMPIQTLLPFATHGRRTLASVNLTTRPSNFLKIRSLFFEDWFPFDTSMSP